MIGHTRLESSDWFQLLPVWLSLFDSIEWRPLNGVEVEIRGLSRYPNRACYTFPVLSDTTGAVIDTTHHLPLILRRNIPYTSKYNWKRIENSEKKGFGLLHWVQERKWSWRKDSLNSVPFNQWTLSVGISSFLWSWYDFTKSHRQKHGWSRRLARIKKNNLSYRFAPGMFDERCS